MDSNFKSGFKTETSIDNVLNTQVQKDDFFGGSYHPWRRFFARTIDVFAIGFAVSMPIAFLYGFLFSNKSEYIVVLLNDPVAVIVINYLIYLPIDALFISFSGTTPSKWIFGIEILHTDGYHLSFINAFKRSCLVWIVGEGLGVPFVLIFTRYFAYRRLIKTGNTIWDKYANSVVIYKKWNNLRTITCIVYVVSIIYLFSILDQIFKHYP